MQNRRTDYEKHDLSSHPLYSRWERMKDRCYNENNIQFRYYGGKGIRVCEEWRNSFLNFYNWAIKNGFREDLEIDRRDGNKNYEPSNCRFITKPENAKNIPSQRKRKNWGIVKTRNGGFYVRVYFNGKVTSVGSHATEEIAIEKRDAFFNGQIGAYEKRKDVGVYENKWGFIAHAVIDKKCHHVGTFKTKEEAITKRAEFIAKYCK